MHRFRVITADACNGLLGLFLAAALLFQCRDFQNASEVVPAGSFAVLLSLAGFAISWARVNPPNATESEQRRVKRAGLDLLIASALTLVSAGLLLLSNDPMVGSSVLQTVLLALHITVLAAGLVLGWIALARLLREAARAGTAG